MSVMFFCGLFAPAGTPSAILARINQSTQTLLHDWEFQAKLLGLGYEAVLDKGPIESDAFIRLEQQRWTPIVRSSGATL